MTIKGWGTPSLTTRPFVWTPFAFQGKAYPIREKTLGPDHPHVAMALNNLYDLAEPVYQRSLAIFEKALGPDHPSTAIGLANLAHLLALTRRFPEAERRARRAHGVLESALGAEHPRTKETASRLAAIEEALRSGSG